MKPERKDSPMRTSKFQTSCRDEAAYWTVPILFVLVVTILYAVMHGPAWGDVPEQRIRLVPSDQPLPLVRKGNVLLVSPLYVASLNPETKFVDWVLYTLTPALSETENSLVRNWRTVLKDEALEDPDYVGSGYDRGHMIPLASVAASPFAWTVNRLEVIVPQRPDLNQGAWLRLEDHLRDLVRTTGTVRVWCGTLYKSAQPALPASDEPHRVPSHFWLIAESTAGTEAYILPQDAPRDAPLDDYRLETQAAADLRKRLFPRNN